MAHTHLETNTSQPGARELLWRAFVIFAGTRLLVFAAAYAWLLLDPQQAVLDPGSPLWHGDPGGHGPLAEPWRRWDALWFLQTARQGYAYIEGAQSNLSIFPLYPLLIAGLDRLGLDAIWAGVLISNAALFLAVVLLLKLAWPRAGGAAAQRAVLALLVFPPAFVLSGIYSESLFLCAALGAFYFGERREWAEAGLCAFAAALTRITGAALVIPLAVMYFSNRPQSEPRIRALWMLLPLLAVALFFIYVHGGTDSYVTYFRTQAHWDKQLAWPWVGLGWEMVGGTWRLDHVLNVSAFVLFSVLGVAAWRRYGPAWGVYALLGVLMPACSSRWIGMPRYMLVLFPGFVMLGEWLRDRRLAWAWIAGSAVLMLVCFRMFLNWQLSF